MNGDSDIFAALLNTISGKTVAPPAVAEQVTATGPDGAYQSPTGRHRHQCERCHTVWEHDSVFSATRAGHTCPNPECGHCPEGSCWEKYFGGDAPAYHDPGQKTFRKADGVPMKKADGSA